MIANKQISAIYKKIIDDKINNYNNSRKFINHEKHQIFYLYKQKILVSEINILI